MVAAARKEKSMAVVSKAGTGSNLQSMQPSILCGCQCCRVLLYCASNPEYIQE